MIIRKLRRIKKELNTIEKANAYMDRITDNLSNYDLKRCYLNSKEKYERKQNKNTLYMMNYFKSKCYKRGIHI